MTIALSLSVALFGLLLAAYGQWQARHSAKRYKSENEDAEFDGNLQRKLMAMEILGVPGNPDWPSLRQRLLRIHDRLQITDERAARIELNVHDMQKELHPNGGGSMRDDVTETRRLAEVAAAEAQRVAAALTDGERPVSGG